VAAYREFGADKIVAEGNYGGLMVVETIKSVDKTVPVEIVTASRSKRQRAEPVAALYEQGRIHHVGQLAKLEDELISWTPESGWSPGRMDALVWAISWLNLAGNAAGEGYSEFLKLKAAESTVCRGRPNGHHLWRDGLCTLCYEPKEAA
jgi:phage terminase large subunit-like protein